VAATNGNLHLDCQNGYETYINHYSGNRTFLYETRLNIMYDRDDSYYYWDGNTWSRMWGLGLFYLRNNYDVSVSHPFGMSFSTDVGCQPAYAIYRECGGWSYPYPDLHIAFHTGIKMGANSSYQGMRFYNDYYWPSLLFQINGSSEYFFKYRWMFTTESGFYSNYNGAHWYPNYGSSYGAWRTDGNRNGWYGISIGTGNNPHVMFDGSGNGGMYVEGYGRWLYYHYLPYNCIGINTSATSPSYGMYVSRGIYATENIVAYSDRRAKENIITIDSALDKLLQMRGVYYNRIDDKTKKRQIGVIAQEVDEVLPEVVTYCDVNDEYGVAYGNLAGLFIESIKDQQKIIDKQTKEIDSLRLELQKIKDFIFNNKG